MFGSGRVVGGSSIEQYNPWQHLISGRYYNAQMTQTGSISALSPGADNLRLFPMWINKKTSFDRIGVNVTGTAVGGLLKCGIYKDKGDGDPTGATLVAASESGELDCSSAALVLTTVDFTLNPGLYWGAVLANDAAITIDATSNSSWLGGTDGQSTHGRSWAASLAYTDTLPATMPTQSIDTASPRYCVIRAV